MTCKSVGRWGICVSGGCLVLVRVGCQGSLFVLHVVVFFDCRYFGLGGDVPTVSIRDLANKASAVVDEVAKSGKPAVVTKRGKPVAAVVPIDPDALDDWVLANAPEYVKARREADRDLANGRTVSLDDL